MIGKAAIFLKHRASKIGGMFRGKDLKNKTTIAKFKADSFFKANPKKSIVAGTVGVAGLAGVLDGGDRQKMKIEAQKAKELGFSGKGSIHPDYQKQNKVKESLPLYNYVC